MHGKVVIHNDVGELHVFTEHNPIDADLHIIGNKSLAQKGLPMPQVQPGNGRCWVVPAQSRSRWHLLQEFVVSLYDRLDMATKHNDMARNRGICWLKRNKLNQLYSLEEVLHTYGTVHCIWISLVAFLNLTVGICRRNQFWNAVGNLSVDVF